jgi:hypothetical protein
VGRPAEGHPFATIRERIHKYPYTADDKLGYEGGADASALENGIRGLPMYWPAPPSTPPNPSTDPERPPSDTDPVIGVVAGTDSNGLSLTLFVPAGYTLSTTRTACSRKPSPSSTPIPTPYLVVAANDGLYFRHLNRPKGSPPSFRDGHYVPEMPGSAALFVLARRERSMPCAPSPSRTPTRTCWAASRTAPASPASFSPTAALPNNSARPWARARHEGLDRWPTVPEWLAAAKASPNAPTSSAPRVSLLDVATTWCTPQGYTHPWFPIPWNKDQLETFDRLPTLGYLHRPTYIPLTDADGKPSPAAASASRPSSGLEPGPRDLPEAQRQAALKRVISSTGGSPDTLVELTALIDAQAGRRAELHLDKPANGSTSSPASATPARPAGSWAWRSA